MRRLMMISLAGCIAGLSSCGMSRRDQLEAVAKEWCETIRASQIVPVYPLTEDIQPGDIFLVQVPVDRQQEIYRKRGFLPMDNHLARMNPTGYSSFYDHSFIAPGATTTLPRDWSRPGGVSATSWEPAPNAAFPSYSFTVTKSGGLNLAIPISGVPVGLGMIGTQEARGTVTIDDARTLGIDTMSLHQEVTEWADNTPGVREFLSNFGDDSAQPANYLRVITRVYATGRVSVLLTDARSFSAAADAGAAKPVDLFVPRSPTRLGDTAESARENYTMGLGHLNEMMNSRDGAATHASGEDAGLNAEQLAAKAKGRAEARANELQEAEAARKAAASSVDEAEEKAAPLLKDLQEKRKKQAEEAEKLASASQKVRNAEATLKVTQPNTPEHTAAKTEFDNAVAAQTAAKTSADNATKAADEAERAYKPKAEVVATTRGTLDVRQAALARLTNFAPGGSVRFTMASSRAVAMEETFKPPLVIGYLGFDMPIRSHGRLGPPIPTYALVSNEYTVAVSQEGQQARKLNESLARSAAYRSLVADSSKDARSLNNRIDRLAKYIPQQTSVVKIDPSQPKGFLITSASRSEWSTSGQLSFNEYTLYRDRRNSSRRAINSLLTDGVAQTSDGQITNMMYELTSQDVKNLQAVDQELQKGEGGPEERDYQSSIRALLDYYSKTLFR